MRDETVKRTWLWTKVPMYFIYPPGIFQFTSLFFNHHSISNQVQNDLTIQLPTACYSISSTVCPINGENVTVVHNRYLDVLTNEVKHDS